MWRDAQHDCRDGSLAHDDGLVIFESNDGAGGGMGWAMSRHDAGDLGSEEILNLEVVAEWGMTGRVGTGGYQWTAPGIQQGGDPLG